MCVYVCVRVRVSACIDVQCVHANAGLLATNVCLSATNVCLSGFTCKNRVSAYMCACVCVNI